MRILVCGGRDYRDAKTVFEALDYLQPSVVIHGDARGADTLADVWACLNDVEVQRFAADWNKHGRKAGPIRNQEMADCSQADLCLAFPGNWGTEDMVKKARAAGIDVMRWPEDIKRFSEPRLSKLMGESL